MIKKRNLDPSLIQWIMTQTGLGAGIGEIFWVAPENMSSTSQYRTQLQSWGVEQDNVIHTLPSLAYKKTINYRNDVVLVLPATYAEEETLTWANSNTHMLGVGNPTWRQGGKTRIGTTTEGVSATINVTGSGVHFGGFNITNDAEIATNVTALRLSGTYFSARNLDLRGQLKAEQSATAVTNTSSLEFAAGTSYGFASTFDDCNFGTASQETRVGLNGVIRFATTVQSGSPAAYTEFNRCRIGSRAETATIPMVRVEGVYSIDRNVTFNDCQFYNYWSGTGKLAKAFLFASPGVRGAAVFMLNNCYGYGIEEWSTGSGYANSVVSNNGNSGLMWQISEA